MSCIVNYNVDLESLQLVSLNVENLKQEVCEIGDIKVEGKQDENRINVVGQSIDKNTTLLNREYVWKDCNAIKSEVGDDFHHNEENKYYSNVSEDSIFTWNPESAKIERCDNFHVKSEFSTSKYQDSNKVISTKQVDGHLQKDKLCSKHKCDFCFYSTKKKSHLKRHIDSIHNKLKRFKCNSCDYGAFYISQVKIHMKMVHLKLKNNKCDLCNFGSSVRGDLQKHINSVHLKLNNHKCELCQYSTSTKATLQRHINSVHLKMKKPRNQNCVFCNFSSSHKSNLQRHIKMIHLKLTNHICDICKYSTSRKCNLQRHIKSVHLNIRIFKCVLCNFSSSRKDVLQRHMQSKLDHLKLGNQKCDLCSYCSVQSSDLVDHILNAHLKLIKPQMLPPTRKSAQKNLVQ